MNDNVHAHTHRQAQASTGRRTNRARVRRLDESPAEPIAEPITEPIAGPAESELVESVSAVAVVPVVLPVDVVCG